MEYNDSVAYMLKTPFFGKKNGLDNIKALLEKLDNPQDKIATIHIAGTNGKGSVATFLSCIYNRANYKVGLFTSPHLVEINERIKINNQNISNGDFTNCFISVKDKINEMVLAGLDHPTFFEVIYAMAVLYFAEQGVDMAIIETGLGGRLDSTNMIKKPVACVITKISLDHTKVLGDTLEAIAREKAGIIKEGCNVVVAEQKEVVNTVFKKVCKEKEAYLYKDSKYSCKISNNTFKTIDFLLNTKYHGDIALHINGGVLYQVNNCLLSIAVIESLLKLYSVQVSDIILGVEDFYWPGRMEVINDSCILDGSHNIDGIRQFVDFVNTYLPNTPIELLFTLMENKNHETIIKELCTLDNICRVIITKTSIQKNANTLVLADEFKKHSMAAVEIEEDICNAFLNNYKVARGSLFCCLGSLYLVGEVKKIITGGYARD